LRSHWNAYRTFYRAFNRSHGSFTAIGEGDTGDFIVRANLEPTLSN
jgi:hypothetical protein